VNLQKSKKNLRNWHDQYCLDINDEKIAQKHANRKGHKKNSEWEEREKERNRKREREYVVRKAKSVEIERFMQECQRKEWEMFIRWEPKLGWNQVSCCTIDGRKKLFHFKLAAATLNQAWKHLNIKKSLRIERERERERLCSSNLMLRARSSEHNIW